MKIMRTVAISCTLCGYSTVPGKKSTTTDVRGNTVVRIKWVCPRCGGVSRKETVQ